MMQDTMYALQNNVKILKSDVNKYAVYGAIIAFSSIAIATVLVALYEAGTISMQSVVDVHKNNAALWILDLTPFGFALWGQYVGSMISYQAGALVVDQTCKLRAQATALKLEAAHGATHDSLTGLPNRTLVRDRLNQAIVAAQDENRQLAIILLDLDRFSELNSSLSRHHGDQALTQIAGRLRGLARETDTIGRIGPDVFAFLALKIASTAEAERIAAGILRALKTPFVLDGVSVDIQGSLGISMFPMHGSDTDSLMQRAELAMLAAKRGKSGYAVYKLKHDKSSPRNITLAGEMRQTLESGGMSLHYQPKLDLKNMQVQGVEALARWRRPDGSEISPNEFVPLAERTGLIKQFTLWVVTHALEQLSAWDEQGLSLSVSINVSAQDLINDDLFDHLTGMLASHNLDPGRIVLEITETSIMLNEEQTSIVLKRFSDSGIRLSIDDFGTGYSSLAHLGQLPIHEIKIDRSFVNDMMTNFKHAQIVCAIINLGHNMGLNVVAEGVASRESRRELLNLKCDEIQGNSVSSPLPGEEMLAWLKQIESVRLVELAG